MNLNVAAACGGRAESVPKRASFDLTNGLEFCIKKRAFRGKCPGNGQNLRIRSRRTRLRIDEDIKKLNSRIELFETYIHKNGLQKDFERFCREHKKQEKRPLKDQIPKR